MLISLELMIIKLTNEKKKDDIAEAQQESETKDKEADTRPT